MGTAKWFQQGLLNNRLRITGVFLVGTRTPEDFFLWEGRRDISFSACQNDQHFLVLYIQAVGEWGESIKVNHNFETSPRPCSGRPRKHWVCAQIEPDKRHNGTPPALIFGPYNGVFCDNLPTGSSLTFGRRGRQYVPHRKFPFL